jgi:hypothetical protein
MLKSVKSLGVAVLAIGVAGLVAVTPVSAQTSEYYLHAGDQSSFIVIQSGAIVRTWTVAGGTHQYQYPMAVRDTIRTMGANEGDIGAEYDLFGGDLGARYTHPAGPVRSWDGTTNGTNFFAIDTIGNVYQYDDDWTNPVLLFGTSGLGSITYDPSNDSLWVSHFSGSNNITEYSMSGAVLSTFSAGHTRNMALALDPADDTLWLHDRNVLGTYEQWTKTGVLLTRIAVPGMSGFNALSGEFQFGGMDIQVDIDIKFCSDPNAFNCKKNGVLPVTIFGTGDFLVEDIDPSSLRLCNSDLSVCTEAPRDYSYADRGDPLLDLGAAMCAIDSETGEELDWTENQDTYVDLDAAFEASEVKTILGDFCDDAAKGAVSEALVIIGETYDGVPIYSVPQDDNTGIDRLVKVNK